MAKALTTSRNTMRPADEEGETVLMVVLLEVLLEVLLNV